MRFSRLSGRTAFLALLLAGARASAQPADGSTPESAAPATPAGSSAQVDEQTRQDARDLAVRGTEAFERHQYDLALDFFRRASSLVRAPTIALMEARCLAQLGRLVEAVDEYETTERMPLPAETNRAFESAIAAAAAEGARLKARVPRIDVRLSGPAPDGPIPVFLDGRSLPEALLGSDAPVDPGSHRVELRLRDRHPVIREVSVEEGGRAEVVLDVPPPPLVAPPPVPERSSGGGFSSRVVLAWSMLGAGGVFGVVGAVTGVAALAKERTLDRVCVPDDVCPSQDAGELGAFRAYRTVSYAAFGLGVAAAGTGAVLLVAGGPKRSIALSAIVGGARLEGTF